MARYKGKFARKLEKQKANIWKTLVGKIPLHKKKASQYKA